MNLSPPFGQTFLKLRQKSEVVRGRRILGEKFSNLKVRGRCAGKAGVECHGEIFYDVEVKVRERFKRGPLGEGKFDEGVSEI